jgi:ATP-dependent protease ClpP protease subunit
VRSWYQFRNELPPDGDAGKACPELLLYGEIGGWGISAGQFLTEARAAIGDASQFRVRISSPGGSVFDGLTIYNGLRALGKRVLVSIDGLAASIASVIAACGDEVTMPANTMQMIHNPWTIAAGDSEELRKTAEAMDAMKAALVASYARKTAGKTSPEAISAAMDAETWFTAQESVDFGLADIVTDAIPAQASIVARDWGNTPAEAHQWLMQGQQHEEQARDGVATTTTDGVDGAGEPGGTAEIEQSVSAASDAQSLSELSRRCDEAYSEGVAAGRAQATEQARLDMATEMAATVVEAQAAVRAAESRLEAANSELVRRDGLINGLQRIVDELNAKFRVATERLKSVCAGMHFDSGDGPSDYWQAVSQLEASGMPKAEAITAATARYPVLHQRMIAAANPQTKRN